MLSTLVTLCAGCVVAKDRTKFAGLLDTYFQQAGLPLRRVASQTGIPHQTLFNWLNGSQPRWHAALPDDLLRLGNTLGLDDDEIALLLHTSGCITARQQSANRQEVKMGNSYRIPNGWFVMGDSPDKYEMGVDPIVTYENHPSITIKAGPEPTEFAGLAQGFKADAYRGKRLRFSAAMRSVDLENRAGLWMRIDGADGKMLAMDNMKNHYITGTTDWAHHAIVLDVAEEAESIIFGALLSLSGQVWVSDIQLETVGKDVPTTDMRAEIEPYFPTNLDFNEQQSPQESKPAFANPFNLPTGWHVTGDAPELYEMGIDPTVVYEKGPTVSIRSHPNAIAFGGLAQTFKAEAYHGKRIRYSAGVRAENVGNCAALFMRIAGPEDKRLAFDNLLNRQISGTQDWMHHAIVLDVAEEAEEIMLGFFLAGNGQIWVGDVRLEMVGKEVPTTDVEAEIAPYFPVNLGFEG